MTKPKTSARKRSAPLSIIDCSNDPAIWQPWFKNSTTWAAWFAFLKVMFGLPLAEADLATFRTCTGRDQPSPEGYLEATLVIGRRGGKSLVLALIAAYLACFRDWTPYLAPGERGHIVVIAADKKQAQAIFKYLRALLGIPLLANLIERETQETVDLTNRITIEVLTANFRTVRGRTVVASLCDELAFWMVDENSSSPDTEIIAALRPAAATVPGAIMLKASSPYARRGVLWDDHRKHFGQNSNVLVWQAATRVMNPSVPQSFIDAETEKDPANAAAEYGAQFRTDVESFVSREVVEAAIVPGRHELPPIDGVTYFAFCDPSGGSSDSMTVAIAHREGDRVVIDAVRERRAPFSPADTVSEFASLLKSYKIARVHGDRYAGMWPREAFGAHGITYLVADRPKSDLYRDFLPALNANRVDLLDLPRLAAQLCSLERRTARGGRDSIDHPPNQRDDLANAVAGVVALALIRVEQKVPIVMPFVHSVPRSIPGSTASDFRSVIRSWSPPTNW